MGCTQVRCRCTQAEGKSYQNDPCFHCGEFSHWKRNCKVFLEEAKRKKKKGEVSTSGIYVIEVNVSTTTSISWVLDTECGVHICGNVQALKNSRTLAQGELDLRVGNGAKVAALAVGVYSLTLPTGLVLELEDCYYVPTITRNIIFVSCLDKKGFCFVIKNSCCIIYLNDIFLW